MLVTAWRSSQNMCFACVALSLPLRHHKLPNSQDQGPLKMQSLPYCPTNATARTWAPSRGDVLYLWWLHNVMRNKSLFRYGPFFLLFYKRLAAVFAFVHAVALPAWRLANEVASQCVLASTSASVYISIVVTLNHSPILLQYVMLHCPYIWACPQLD